MSIECKEDLILTWVLKFGENLICEYKNVKSEEDLICEYTNVFINMRIFGYDTTIIQHC